MHMSKFKMADVAEDDEAFLYGNEGGKLMVIDVFICWK